MKSMEAWSQKFNFEALVPVSAKHGTQVTELVDAMVTVLPPGPPFFPEESLTDMPERFIAAEMIREKAFRLTGQEIPYSVAVTVDSFRELPKVKFDDAFHVAVAGDAVYFGSSVDNKIYSLEAATGKLRWVFFTGGPVRLAPTVHGGRVYVGSDDGYVYCLNAADGSKVWSNKVSGSNQLMFANGRMVSICPVRTSVLVDNNVAYWGAGLFDGAMTGLARYLCAHNAADGVKSARPQGNNAEKSQRFFGYTLYP